MNDVQIILETLKVNQVLWHYLEWRQDIIGTYKYLSPFKSEKTPSLVWTDDKWIWKDFSSWRWGNVITFVQEYLQVSFFEALIELNETFDLHLELGGNYNSEEAKKQRRIMEFHKVVTEEMSKRLFLPKNKKYLDFIKEQRQLSEETIKRFNIWLSLNRDMEDFIRNERNKNFTDIDLKETSFYNENGYFFFADRYMFPICNKSNKIVAFSWLRMNKEQEPKYINSSDNIVFTKWNNIFNLNQVQRTSDISKNEIFLCEGNIDSIQLYNYGSSYAASVLGTAFTTIQQRLLHNFDKVTLIFDNDDAGVAATKKYALALYALWKIVYVLNVPKNYNWEKIKDIDEYLKARPELNWEVDEFIINNRKEYLSELLIDTYAQYKEKLDVENSVLLLNEIKKNFLSINRKFDTKIIAYKTKLEQNWIFFNETYDPLEVWRERWYPELRDEDKMDLTFKEFAAYEEERARYLELWVNNFTSTEEVGEDDDMHLTKAELTELMSITKQEAINYIVEKYPELEEDIKKWKFGAIMRIMKADGPSTHKTIPGIDKLIKNKQYTEIYSKLSK